MFTPATRKTKKLRMSLAGPSGSGKTYTALAIGAGLAQGGKIALIDTERGSASLYSDRFTFDVVELDDFNPESYIKAIAAASEAGYRVLIIDSLSHAWFGQGGVLDQVTKRGGNSFTDGWGKVGTPLQNRLMDAILSAPLHVIATMRVKSEYVIEPDARGKSVPRRIGLKEVQREGVEYEFDVVGLMDLSNTLTIEKSRMPDLTGAIIDKPDAKIAARILKWLAAEPAVSESAPRFEAAAPAPAIAATTPTQAAPATPAQPTLDEAFKQPTIQEALDEFLAVWKEAQRLGLAKAANFARQEDGVSTIVNKTTLLRDLIAARKKQSGSVPERSQPAAAGK